MFHACSSSNHIAWAWMQTALTTAATTKTANSSSAPCGNAALDRLLRRGRRGEGRERACGGGRHPRVIDACPGLL